MKTGLIDCTHDTGISQPNSLRSSCLSEYSVTTVNCCWYSDQNAALAMNIGMNASTRLRSTVVILRLDEDDDEVADRGATIVMHDDDRRELVGGQHPGQRRARDDQRPPRRADAIIGSRRSAGSGLGTWCADSGRRFRPKRVLDQADGHADGGQREAGVEAQVVCTSPVSSGPKKAPRLMPR